jgi:non-heme chloroperoxidase
MPTDKPVGATLTTEHEAGQIGRANASGRTPAVFVHGLWLLSSSWDRWADLFETAGWVALTHRWPDDPETTAQASAHLEAFAGKSIGQGADPFAAIVGSLTEQPAIIGHSFGGLLTQILAGRGLARGIGGHRPCAVPRRAAAAGLRAEVSVGGARQPGEPAARCH